MRCHKPIYIEKKGRISAIPVNCGKCVYCKKRRVNSWVFRMTEEEKVSFSSYFITLTYDNKNVPVTKNGFMTLNKKDVQDYMKRLRYFHEKKSDKKLVYYFAGEYGPKTFRPHYHAIVFNVMDPELFGKAWQKGQVVVGNVIK